MEKHQALASSGYSQKLLMYTNSCLDRLFIFEGFSAFFYYLMPPSVGTSGKLQKLLEVETFLAKWNMAKMWGQVDVRCAIRVLLYLICQKIICWKPGRGCHFDSNGTIYIFNYFFFPNKFLINFDWLLIKAREKELQFQNLPFYATLPLSYAWPSSYNVSASIFSL